MFAQLRDKGLIMKVLIIRDTTYNGMPLAPNKAWSTVTYFIS